MCQKKGVGPRCAHHTKPGYLAAMDSIDRSEKEAENKEAITAYASTPSGSKEVMAQIGVLHNAGDRITSIFLAECLAKGQEEYQGYRELAKQRNAERKAERIAARLEARELEANQSERPVYTEPAKYSLSPSRASDYKNCPLKYRYLTIDKFKEPKTVEPLRGTLVHSVLERLFDVEPAERTPEYATSILPTEWAKILEQNPEYGELVDENGSAEWLQNAQILIDRYFLMEDPRRANPYKREERIDYRFNEDMALKGFIDRLDKNAAGDIRVLDYKTGNSPSLGRVDKALFQLKFYALAIYKETGSVPKELKLMYLGDGNSLTYNPTEKDMEETEEQIGHLWTRIKSSIDSGEFKPRKTPLCGWCSFKDKCPEFGGTIPPMPSASSPAPLAVPA
jgi:putative RecB family exonuclease